MRRRRHLKRSKKDRDRKSNPNRKDRFYYKHKGKKAIIESRTGRGRYRPYLDTHRPDMPWLDQIKQA